MEMETVNRIYEIIKNNDDGDGIALTEKTIKQFDDSLNVTRQTILSHLRNLETAGKIEVIKL